MLRFQNKIGIIKIHESWPSWKTTWFQNKYVQLFDISECMCLVFWWTWRITGAPSFSSALFLSDQSRSNNSYHSHVSYKSTDSASWIRQGTLITDQSRSLEIIGSCNWSVVCAWHGDGGESPLVMANHPQWRVCRKPGRPHVSRLELSTFSNLDGASLHSPPPPLRRVQHHPDATRSC